MRFLCVGCLAGSRQFSSENSFVTHLCHLPHTPGGRGEIGFWVRNVTESSQEMDVTLALCEEEAAAAAAARWWCVCTLLAYRQRQSPICSPSNVASICHSAAAAVMALLLGYGLVTLRKCCYKPPCPPPPALHNLPGISTGHLSNALSKRSHRSTSSVVGGSLHCNNLVKICDLFESVFLSVNSKFVFQSFSSPVRHLYVSICIYWQIEKKRYIL